MRAIERILNTIEYSVDNALYEAIDKDGVWLGVANTGRDWTEISKNICAFLNSEGGGLMLGVEDTGSSFVLKGSPDRLPEEIRALSSSLKDGRGEALDLSDYLNVELRPFKDMALALITVDALLEEDRYCTLQGQAYLYKDGQLALLERERLQAHQDYLLAASSAPELTILPEAKLDDLSLEKINYYAQHLGRGPFGSLKDAVLFLEREKFTSNEVPTLLGAILCAVNKKELLGDRCDVSFCFEIKNKKLKRKLELELDKTIENRNETNSRIENEIKTKEWYNNKNRNEVSANEIGVKIQNKETVLSLLSISILNAHMHKDYFIEKGIQVNVNSRECSVLNSGRIHPSLLIEKENEENPIKRIVPAAMPTNPFLAKAISLLKEPSRNALGMNELLLAALHNKIDLPYYQLKEEEVRLVIPVGRLVDARMGVYLRAYSALIENRNENNSLSWQEKSILIYLFKSQIENKKSNHTIALNNLPEELDFSFQELKNKKLIKKHPLSNKKNSIFIPNKKLFQIKHKEKLEKLYALPYDEIPEIYQDILNLLFTFTHFSSTPALAAAQVSHNLEVLNADGPIVKIDLDYKKRITQAVNRLAKRNMIIKEEDKRGFLINTKYQIPETLFELKDL